MVDYFKYLATNLDEGTTHISLITRLETSEYEVYTLGNKRVLDINNQENISKLTPTTQVAYRVAKF